MPDLEHAILLAAQAHRGQKDKNGQPYNGPPESPAASARECMAR
jgi:(p)ppGpp synthase/HD superfamily hydrolase